MNPQHPVLETGALPIGATGLYVLLSRFFVRRVLVAERTEFPKLHALRMQPLVLFRVVVTTLALATGQCNSISWHLLLPSLRGGYSILLFQR